MNSKTIHVTVSMAPSNATKKKIENWLTDRYGDHATTWHIDDSILGGIIIFDGDTVFDGSLRSKIIKLKV